MIGFAMKRTAMRVCKMIKPTFTQLRKTHNKPWLGRNVWVTISTGQLFGKCVATNMDGWVVVVLSGGERGAFSVDLLEEMGR